MFAVLSVQERKVKQSQGRRLAIFQYKFAVLAAAIPLRKKILPAAALRGRQGIVLGAVQNVNFGGGITVGFTPQVIEAQRGTHWIGRLDFEAAHDRPRRAGLIALQPDRGGRQAAGGRCNYHTAVF